MEYKKILVVDDEPYMRDFLIETLQRKKYLVEAVGNGSKAIEKIIGEHYDLVITDLRIPEVSGMEVLEMAKKINTDTEVIMITAFGTIENAVEDMQRGAYHYITKPFSTDSVEIIVDRALERQTLRAENRNLRNYKTSRHNQSNQKCNFSSIIGKSKLMRKVFETIDMILQNNITILIMGESGTGKELIAREIHNNSNRKNKPFVKIGCCGMTDHQFDHELFGYEKGYFKNAIVTKKGKLEQANTGTLLLDEIGDFSWHIQSKLLRVLKEREFYRLGNTRPLSVDIRVIVTTNRDLVKEVREGYFCEDLYNRLNGVHIYLPPLRDRKEDIPFLVNHFLRKYCKENDKEIQGIDDEALEKLMTQEWMGNVRELESYIERAVVLCNDEILTSQHFQFEHDAVEKAKQFILDGFTPGMTLQEMEKRLIMSTLASESNNLTRASEVLGISVRALRNKLNEYASEGEINPLTKTILNRFLTCSPENESV